MILLLLLLLIPSRPHHPPPGLLRHGHAARQVQRPLVHRRRRHQHLPTLLRRRASWRKSVPSERLPGPFEGSRGGGPLLHDPRARQNQVRAASADPCAVHRQARGRSAWCSPPSRGCRSRWRCATRSRRRWRPSSGGRTTPRRGWRPARRRRRRRATRRRRLRFRAARSHSGRDKAKRIDFVPLVIRADSVDGQIYRRSPSGSRPPTSESHVSRTSGASSKAAKASGSSHLHVLSDLGAGAARPRR